MTRMSGKMVFDSNWKKYIVVDLKCEHNLPFA
jgi:hypothetical protein